MGENVQRVEARKLPSDETYLAWIKAVDRDIERLVKKRLDYLRLYRHVGGGTLALLDDPYWLRIATQYTGARGEGKLSHDQFCESRTIFRTSPDASFVRREGMSLVTTIPPQVRRFLRLIRGDKLSWSEAADETVLVRVAERLTGPSIGDKFGE